MCIFIGKQQRCGAENYLNKNGTHPNGLPERVCGFGVGEGSGETVIEERHAVKYACQLEQVPACQE
jgi:hypothetical protein